MWIWPKKHRTTTILITILLIRSNFRPIVCASAWNNSASTEQIFMKFDMREFFENLLEKIKISLKSENNNGHFT